MKSQYCGFTLDEIIEALQDMRKRNNGDMPVIIEAGILSDPHDFEIVEIAEGLDHDEMDSVAVISIIKH